jgi:precorrin-2 dehydrogenase/sirohydrochlorin ferrochelatase
MLPLMVDTMALPVLLVGRGAGVLRRLHFLRAGGLGDVRVFSPAPEEAGLSAAAGEHLVERLPTAGELAGARLVFIAGLAEAEAGALAEQAHSAGALVNVEDNKRLSDFFVPGVVRRGDLVVTVSTSGRNPGLTRRLRRYLEGVFGPQWAGRLALLSAARERWRREGVDLQTLAHRTDALIDRKGWLP